MGSHSESTAALLLLVFLNLSTNFSSGAVLITRNLENDVDVASVNTRPIIGILSQEVTAWAKRKYPEKEYTSYIAASYVKFVEGAGARAAPIWIGKPRQYYEDILSKINGVLLPGGATFFNVTTGFSYADAGAHIYDIARQMNEKGNYLPIWGTCLGFELLLYLSANKSEPRTDCFSQSQSLPLEFKDGFKSSRLFESAPSDVIEILRTESVTPNFHMYCVTEQTLKEKKLDEDWRVLSVNHDWDGKDFISTLEHKKFPFYGVQFHPEKNLYEFVQNKNISHTSHAVRASQYFADFFVNETRKNSNKFPSTKEEYDSLIYNFSPVFTGKKGSAFLQQYLFETSGSSKRKSAKKITFKVQPNEDEDTDSKRLIGGRSK